MASERIDIVVTENGTRTVVRNLNDVGKAGKGAGDAVKYLNGLLGGIAVGAALRELQQYADRWTETTNRLRLATSSTEELTEVQERLFRVAQESRTEFSGLASLYGRLALVGKQLGASQTQLLQLTEAVSKSLAVGGTATEQAAGALLQFSQILGAGTAHAEEFNAIIEGAPRLAKAFADGMKEAGGSVARLRGLVLNGKVSSDQLFKALLSQLPQLRKEFEQTAPTIGQAFTVLDNAIGRLVGQGDRGFSAAIAKGLITVSDHLQEVAKWSAVVGTALLVAFGPALLAAFAAATAAALEFTVALATNPFGLVAVALSTAITYLVVFGGELKPVADGLASVHDYARAAFEYIRTQADVLANVFKQQFPNAVETARNAFVDSFSVMGGMVKTLADSTKAFGNVFINTLRASDAIRQFLASGGGESGLEGLGEQLKKIYAEDVIGSLLKAGKDGVYDFMSAWKTAAEEIARQRAELDAQKPKGPAANLDATPTTQKTLDSTKEQKLKALVEAYDKVSKANNDLIEGTQLLDDALGASNGVTLESRNRLLEMMKQQLRDQLDPLGAVNREIDREINLAGMDKDAREALSKAIEYDNKLRDQGVVISNEEFEALVQKLEKLGQVNKAYDTLSALLEKIRGPQKDYQDALVALNDLLAKGAITQGEFTQALLKLKIEALDNNKDWMSGVERGLLKLQDTWSDYASAAEDAVVNGFHSMEDSLTQFVAKGKLDVHSLADSIISDLARIAVRATITKPLLGLAQQALPTVLNFFNPGGGTPVQGLGMSHQGGIPGVGAGTYRLPASDLASAFRYHSGGIAGLRPNEVPAVLEAGEEVLTRDDPRHRYNGGAQEKLTVNVYNNSSANTQTRVETRDGRGGRSLDIIIEDVVAQGVTRPGSPINKAIRQSFSLNNTVTPR